MERGVKRESDRSERSELSLGSYKYTPSLDEDGNAVKKSYIDRSTGEQKEIGIRVPQMERGTYVPCKIDFERMTIEDEAVTFDKLQEHSIWRPELTQRGLI